ncbi:hypothetical protein VC83_07447 [Pseudogymnoascus destructans]|uniref:Uncharacterized protein n=1 Tax=Pseudogymnoascus destructans TaxID=655981 RepID=A0A177A1I1_9PEZI|nr:uncharacterized protein VC83_07447 [Pseudogymnoascus destructans]OAF56135.1 hypothetical protein VC83_07447 [Pseudogymnoascus destructans]
MDLSNFLNPAEEAMAPYIQVSDAQDDDDEEPQRPVLTTQNTIQALQALIEFSESENSGVERQLVAKQANDLVQAPLVIALKWDPVAIGLERLFSIVKRVVSWIGSSLKEKEREEKDATVKKQLKDLESK